MKRPVILLISSLFLAALTGWGQKISYAEPERDDARTLNFDVIGKVGGQVLVYKNYRDAHYVSAYDNDMKLIEKNKLDFFPDNRILNTDFLQYPDYAYIIYQYQKKNILYCMAAKIDGHGKKIGEPVLLDTTANVNYNVTNKVYSFINSDDRQRFMVFKINSRNDRSHILTTLLFDKDLSMLKRTRVAIPMPQRNDFLSEFSLANDGDLACIRASGTASNDNINKVTLITKPADSDQVFMTDLRLNNLYLDDVRIKVDNLNKHYVITSFFSKTRRGNIDGLYYYLWDKQLRSEILTASTTFSDEFRADAKGDRGLKTAFNDFFLKNIVVRKDGGFMVAAESAYTTSRGNALNRWDYLYGSPYWMSSDYYAWSNPMGYYPWWRYNSFNNTLTRYYADNIAVISFDPKGKLEWSNVIRKSQYDDNSDNFIGYGVMNSGDQFHFLFNTQERRDQILTLQSVSPSGQITRPPTLKNLDMAYEFMPRHAKQVGARQMVIPCQYRGYTCFAKIEF
ncbi:hypothetical protein [Sediminibacterium ginsengisoli]|uniref:Uncharacterized protein n=1 Tax=Sediminibacterium ginsengisoli TaxID=413434 RepID=A0A1T4K710_9BACT|nr:hypothetical protein [Sediminibacterium ginsengisoli]SJZ38117.1 hypothetical protein SAMN04488132_101495 [Sediminibacterium ginsengisoli]